MKRFVRSEWFVGPSLGILTVLAVAITQTGAGGAYLFGIGFLAIAIAIMRFRESVP